MKPICVSLSCPKCGAAVECLVELNEGADVPETCECCGASLDLYAEAEAAAMEKLIDGVMSRCEE
jgi:hypothetical protein